MGKLKPMIENRVVWVVMAAAVCIAIALPAIAGTMYSWRTPDGSQAFTDDPKRIPARYRDDAARRPMGHLEDYSRYTPSELGTKEAYGERLERRLEHLRATTRPQTGAAAPKDLRLGVDVGEDFISMPLNGDGEAPTVIESVRLGPDSMHITTRHATKIHSGDGLIVIRKAERNDTAPRDWAEELEADPEQ
jgi:hypothetical protein